MVLLKEISNWLRNHLCFDPLQWKDLCGNLQDINNHTDSDEEESDTRQRWRKNNPGTNDNLQGGMNRNLSCPLSTVLFPQFTFTAINVHEKKEMEYAMKKGMIEARRSNNAFASKDYDDDDDTTCKNSDTSTSSEDMAKWDEPSNKEKNRNSHKSPLTMNTSQTLPTAASTAEPPTTPAFVMVVAQPPKDIEHLDPDCIIPRTTVSELTMQSLGEAYWKSMSLLAGGSSTTTNMQSRRMAYYAIGSQTQDHSQQLLQQRQCFFTGTPILSSSPFYAGVLHRHLQSLVVLCAYSSLLPALQLPSNTTLLDAQEQQIVVNNLQTNYPEMFSQLPAPLRQASSWKLYTKFCSFSGLPIAEGEMHYFVSSDKLQKVEHLDNYEDVFLSHEVMIAIHGETSAELLKLPNTKTLTYLSTFYPAQSSKYPPSVFVRDSWEAILPEC